MIIKLHDVNVALTTNDLLMVTMNDCNIGLTYKQTEWRCVVCPNEKSAEENFNLILAGWIPLIKEIGDGTYRKI
jgi:hypothetical protein